MSDTPPDHLAIDARSPFHNADALNRGVGVRFNGVERDNVEEYSVSEGWIKVQVGKARYRRGNPMTMKIKGEVVAYYLDSKDGAKAAE
ncbi:glutathione peroxidase [Xanthomonas phaseoli pv. phaseoli]|uniref:DUF3297 family protein n=1 Tax=Xanthomonas phaseoli TaxID=1985254 RepID=UPI0005735128|nr:DUF3297 family protein [Xanthomonas phaseoli]KHS06978.1 glutathione peroxidase [Xanthomonas phaseoli pv. phaseoli]